MTIDEAKASLQALCHTCKHFPTCVNDKPECFQAIEMAIKALEQQPCDDWYDVPSNEMTLEQARQAIKDLRKKLAEYLGQPKWIPVSERLPEVDSEVLVCYEFKKKRYVYIANFYGNGSFHGYDDEYLTPECRKYRRVVAWMPLPEPYKAGDTE